MEYITTKEASEKWGISTIRITILANEGRIPGAYRLGKSWLIPASATKPKARRSRSKASADSMPDTFSFPLYHFRPDWNKDKEAALSKQEKILLRAETAIWESRFNDAYPLLESIIKSPDDIVIEIGALGLAGMCCMALNRFEDYCRFNMRLQRLLSDDFPHRDDLKTILDLLKTYVETLTYSAKGYTYNPDINEQCLPLVCVLIGFAGYAKESIKSGSADISMLELILRFVKTTGAVIAMEFIHCHLLSIYDMRQETKKATEHARDAIQIAYENKFYLPLATYYHYYKHIFDPILEEYSEDFQRTIQRIVYQHEDEFGAFLSSINENTALAKLSSEDYAYSHGVYIGLTNAAIAKKLGVSIQTVHRRLEKIFEKVGVENKRELVDYLHKNM